jgi:hypothetical protein
MKPIKVNDADLAFGGDMRILLPKYNDIPDEFKDHYNKWAKIVSDWFFGGLKNAKFTPKEGIDKSDALRHIKAIMTSWDPKHEHKEAGCAYLLSEFFEDVTYEK